jgi:hypothetical protein
MGMRLLGFAIVVRDTSVRDFPNEKAANYYLAAVTQ